MPITKEKQDQKLLILEQRARGLKEALDICKTQQNAYAVGIKRYTKELEILYSKIDKIKRCN